MKKYRLAVSAIVLAPTPSQASQSILLVHKPRKRDAWQLPQGGVEDAETLEEAALRELQEETGLTLSRVDFISPTTYQYDFPPEFLRRYTPVNSGQILHFVVVVSATPLDVVVDQHEIDDALWILPQELPKYFERKAYCDVVTTVLREYESMKRAR